MVNMNSCTWILAILLAFLTVTCSAYTVLPDSDKVEKGSSARRSMFGTMVAPIIIAWNNADAVHAAEPVQRKDTDSILAIIKRKLRAKPPKALRRKLSQDFAVLLMRSSYNALDELDCVAMDQFQRDFFLIRSSEYQDYTMALGAGMVKQGDLTDPYYFDFISFAQYRTINRELTQNPPFVFHEMQPAEQQQLTESTGGRTNFVSTIVRRDPHLTNTMLVPTHSSKVGSAILDRLEELFGNTDSRIPKLGNRPDAGTFSIQVLMFSQSRRGAMCRYLSIYLVDNAHIQKLIGLIVATIYSRKLLFSLPVLCNSAVDKPFSLKWLCLSRGHFYESDIHSYYCC
jgi:hypothetical protein